jgi:hypothetical protein
MIMSTSNLCEVTSQGKLDSRRTKLKSLLSNGIEVRRQHA